MGNPTPETRYLIAENHMTHYCAGFKAAVSAHHVT